MMETMNVKMAVHLCLITVKTFTVIESKQETVVTHLHFVTNFDGSIITILVLYPAITFSTYASFSNSNSVFLSNKYGVYIWFLFVKTFEHL